MVMHCMCSRTGEENIDLVESLRTSKIKLVTVRHEQAGGFMAATVGRLTGFSNANIPSILPLCQACRAQLCHPVSHACACAVMLHSD